MVDIENGPVVAHAQDFADAAYGLLDCRFTTYNGHSPHRTQALDCWDTDTDLDSLADFGRRNYLRYGIDYIIWKQRIWNPDILDDWRRMSDRGSPTQNHYDHLHVSFNASIPDSIDPEPQMEESTEDMFTYSTAPDVDGGSIWLVVAGVAHRLHTIDDASRINKAKVLSLGEMSEAFHNVFEHRG